MEPAGGGGAPQAAAAAVAVVEGAAAPRAGGAGAHAVVGLEAAVVFCVVGCVWCVLCVLCVSSVRPPGMEPGRVEWGIFAPPPTSPPKNVRRRPPKNCASPPRLLPAASCTHTQGYFPLTHTPAGSPAPTEDTTRPDPTADAAAGAGGGAAAQPPPGQGQGALGGRPHARPSRRRSEEGCGRQRVCRGFHSMVEWSVVLMLCLCLFVCIDAGSVSVGRCWGGERAAAALLHSRFSGAVD